jgi:hypothetical protein
MGRVEYSHSAREKRQRQAEIKTAGARRPAAVYRAWLAHMRATKKQGIFYTLLLAF